MLRRFGSGRNFLGIDCEGGREKTLSSAGRMWAYEQKNSPRFTQAPDILGQLYLSPLGTRGASADASSCGGAKTKTHLPRLPAHDDGVNLPALRHRRGDGLEESHVTGQAPRELPILSYSPGLCRGNDNLSKEAEYHVRARTHHTAARESTRRRTATRLELAHSLRCRHFWLLRRP